MKTSPQTTLYVEAKGETSSRERSARFGKPIDAAQCRDHVANAVYAAAAAFSTSAGPLDGMKRIAVALPETERHRECIARVQGALDMLDIGVLWVSRSQQVRLVAKWPLDNPGSGDEDALGPTGAPKSLVTAGSPREVLSESASLSHKVLQQEAQKEPETQMTHAQQIFRAAVSLAGPNRTGTFTGKGVRERLNLKPAAFLSAYTAIFQAMRDDHPGGAPKIRRRYTGVFHRLERGKYQLTDRGCQLARQIAEEHGGSEERDSNPA